MIPKSVSIVIPAFNEELRLPATLRGLQQYCQEAQGLFSLQKVIVVNDGSADRTSQVVAEFQSKWPQLELLNLPVNQGKGAAVHEGLRASVSPWVLVADADMSTPWEEMEKLLLQCEGQSLVMGSRGLPESIIEVRQHWLRQSMGKTFNKILRVLSGLPFKDTQCGFKLIRNDDFFRKQVLPRLQTQRFAWDVELILILLKFNQGVKEVPVRWLHKEQSRVRILQDSFEMLLSVLKLQMKLRHLRNDCSTT